jgi:parvulin-like peptidyl-prolyl isomerase
MKISLLLFTIFLQLLSYSQTREEVEAALSDITRTDQLQELEKAHPDWNIIEITTLASDSLLYPQVVKAKVGDVVMKTGNIMATTDLHKILVEEEVEVCRAQYIFLNGNELSDKELEIIKKEILKRYERGANFRDLIDEYTMEGIKSGDTGWFYKGMMLDEFENAVREHKRGDIFVVEVPLGKRHFIILKTHDNKMEKAKIGVSITYKG